MDKQLDVPVGVVNAVGGDRHLGLPWPSRVVHVLPGDGRLAVHDACIDEVVIDQSSGSLHMSLLSGHQPVGYARLMIELTGFKPLSPAVEELMAILSDSRTQFGYEEVDLAPHGGASPFVVRFILFPEGELAFGFSTLTATYEPLADPNELPCRYLVRMEA